MKSKQHIFKEHMGQRRNLKRYLEILKYMKMKIQLTKIWGDAPKEFLEGNL